MVLISKPSCLKCSRFLPCRDPKKETPKYHCEKFIKLREVGNLLELGELELVPSGSSPNLVMPGADDPNLPDDLPDNFVQQAMDRAYDPQLNMVRDVRYDDSSMPLATNIYDFAANLIGSKVKMPFARQLWMMIHLFGEYCPRCSPEDIESIDALPVDADPHEFNTRYTLLEYGYCPKCGASKKELVYTNKLRDINEFVLVGGQRMGKCLEKGTLILTEQGLLPVEALCEGNAGGWGSYYGPRIVLENGRPVLPSRSYVAKPEPIYRVKLSNGMEIAGTATHPLWTAQGWTELKDIQTDTLIPVRLGQSVFPHKLVSLDPLIKHAQDRFEVYVSNKTTLPTRFYAWDFRKGVVLDEDIAMGLGFYVSEGHCDSWKQEEVRTASVSNDEDEVHRIWLHAIKKLYPDVEAKKGHRRSGFSNLKAAIHFDLLLGENLRAKSADKAVPPLILQSPRRVQKAFLQALFEGDGCINTNRVEYTTISKNLASVVQTMLANFGVYALLKEGFTWASNGSDSQVEKPCFHLRIEGNHSIEVFQERIGFLLERKKAELQSLLDRRTSRTKQNPYKDEVVPEHRARQWAELNDRIREEVESLIQDGYRIKDQSGRITTNMRKNWLAGANRTGPNRWCNLTLGLVNKSWDRLRASHVWPHLSKDLRVDIEGAVEILQDMMTRFATVTCVTKEAPQVTYDIEVPEYHRFMANGLLSHNSTIVSEMASYALHRMLKAPRLSGVARGIQDFSPLTGTFVALTTTNAIKLLWKPFRELIVASEWFEEYFSLLKKYGSEAGRELYQFNPTGNYLRVFTKNLDLYPEGPNKRTLRGPTRFISAVDELGHFPYDPRAGEEDASLEEEDQRERANAEEVVTVLTNSLSTVRTEVYNLYNRDIYAYPQGLNLLTSSPASWRDKIMRMYIEAEGSATTLAVRKPTWEVSPIYTRDHPIIVDLYKKDPRKAERDFGANPPSLDSSVFNKDTIRDLFCLDQTHSIVYHNSDTLTRGAVVQLRKFNHIPPTIMAIDAGLKNNAFAVSIQYRKGALVKVPVCLEIVPKRETKIDFVFAYEKVLANLIKDWNVREVYADRWNSEYILRQIEEDSKGKVKCYTYSLKASDFEAFIDFVHSKQLELPKAEVDFDFAEAVKDYKVELLTSPGAHLYRQFLTVQQIAGMLMKGQGSTDDMLRSVILGVTRLFNEKTTKRMEDYQPVGRDSMQPHEIAIFGTRQPMASEQARIREILLYGNRGQPRNPTGE